MDPVVDSAVEFVNELFASNCGGHDVSHTLRVYRNAAFIAEKEKGCDIRIVALAALLHDADDHKLFNTENNANARGFLSEHGLKASEIERIINAVNSVSFSQNRGKRPDTIEGMVVQDADRLDAIGAIGIARTFAYGGEHGRSIEASVQHFYDKLFLLKNEMNTRTAKKIAERRHSFMESFINELNCEIDPQSDF